MATPADVLPLSRGSDRRRDLEPAPIPACNVIDGQPEASAVLLAERPGGLAAGLWSCTPGRFRWDYASDEVAHIIAGSAIITDQDGTVVAVGPGDIVHFARGTSAVWEVHETIRKVWALPAWRRDPLSRAGRRVRGAAARLRRRGA
jgi:uncharacterized cupin superfamily protein